ncbi:unnamed protein product, partial [Amoebophrya sp. A25]|eukprot:GSA25T00018950001.1
MATMMSFSCFSLEAFEVLFAVSLFFSVVRTFSPLCSFYKWFHESGFEVSNYRGYGQTACRFYGLIPSPHLSPRQHRWAGAAWMMTILAIGGTALTKLNDPLVLLDYSTTTSNTSTSSSNNFVTDHTGSSTTTTGASRSSWGGGVKTHMVLAGLSLSCLMFYHAYISQLFCEAHVGAHVTVMIPPALLQLALYNFGRAEQAGDWPWGRALARSSSNGGTRANNSDRSLSVIKVEIYFAFLVKAVIVLAYSCAGLSKLKTSWRNQKKKKWTDGSTLQACIFEALSLSRHPVVVRHQLDVEHDSFQHSQAEQKQKQNKRNSLMDQHDDVTRSWRLEHSPSTTDTPTSAGNTLTSTTISAPSSSGKGERIQQPGIVEFYETMNTLEALKGGTVHAERSRQCHVAVDEQGSYNMKNNNEVGVREQDGTVGDSVGRSRCRRLLDLPHFTFGVPTPFSDRLQAWALNKVILLQLASTFSVYFEFLAPLILLANFVDFQSLSDFGAESTSVVSSETTPAPLSSTIENHPLVSSISMRP